LKAQLGAPPQQKLPSPRQHWAPTGRHLPPHGPPASNEEVLLHVGAYAVLVTPMINPEVKSARMMVWLSIFMKGILQV
jgi:hypothetical protein